MKKFLRIVVLLLFCNKIIAQPINNEWIDFSKTYYKFKVGTTGLYRINQTTLSSIGVGNTPVEQFQLWRNGIQVPLNTSISSGIMGGQDFIEFWGEMNDGKLDKFLYKNQAHQLSDKLSLQTDTAVYFLTTNTVTSNNLRYSNALNNVAGNSLPAENYFIHKLRFNFKARANRGYALNVGEDVYSSTYDVCEFLSTADINLATGAYKVPLKNMYLFNTGPAAILSAGLAGNSSKTRNIRVKLNATTAFDNLYSGYASAIQTNNNIPLNIFNGTADTAAIEIVTADVFDRVIASFIELQYPRQFNFDGASNFEFKLPASATGNFLQISNFNKGNAIPVLYDITNLKFYNADTALAGMLRFVLPSSSSPRDFVLVSRSTTNINVVSNISSKSFINFASSNNQGDYIIISNKKLTTGVNVVEQYRQYRATAIGGGYNSKYVDVDELVDQFAFGIKKHPISIRNFLKYANTIFSVKPKHVFFIGKGVTYDQYRFNESNPLIETQNLVPTFGWPASDPMLVSPDNSEPAPMFSFGRLSSITPQEVLDYLDKVKLYELQGASTNQTIANKAWMKNLIHVAGGKNDGENNLFTYYLRNYENIIKDTLFGGNVSNFNKTTGSETSPVTQTDMINLFAKGVGIVTYFGHSAASGLAYNLNEPDDYKNTGKFPLFLVNGCTANNIFDFDNIRQTSITNISEKWVLAKNIGSIGFISMSHFGLTTYLDFYSTGFYKSLTKSGYNLSVGQNMMNALAQLKSSATFNDFFGKTHGEQFLLHGDPAIKVYAQTKPDFVIEDEQVSVNPNFISVADNNFTYKTFIHNIGKSVGDSVRVFVRRQYPSGATEDIFNKKIVSVRYKDSVVLVIPIDALRDKGNNSITITVDSDNLYDELSETNNSITKSFVIFEDELKPVYPFQYAIINKAQIKLAASTANAFSNVKQYSMEIDTTALFNSSFKKIKTISSVGGLLEFDPGFNFVDSTVYYWRVAPVPTAGNYRWNSSSFVYLQNATKGGFNQSHFFQHVDNSFNNLLPDSLSRKIDFPIINQTLTIRNAVFPYGGSADGAYSIAINDALNPKTQGICWRGSNVTFTVYNPSTVEGLYNSSSGQPGKFGSLEYTAGCTPGKEYDFAFNTTDINGRKSAMDFMDNNIPNGAYVVVRSVIIDDPYWPAPTYANTWKQDENVYGLGNSLYHKLKSAGFNDVDSFNRMKAFAFVYQKNNNGFTPVWQFTQTQYDFLTLRLNIKTKLNNGFMVSPKLGPAQKWYNLNWAGNRNDLQDMVSLKLIGVKNDNTTDTLQTFTELQTTNDISGISAITYPYLKLQFQVKDTVNLSAYQLRYWRLIADGLPEGALAPNIKFTFKDSLEKGEPQNMAISFKNISDMPYADSLSVRLQITDNSNTTQNIILPKIKKLLSGDTATISTTIATDNLVGKNSFYINVNPTNNPQEQYLYNNFAYKNFYVFGDDKNPLLDVTFDGIHILNGDIVSSKPRIRVALKDESKYLVLNDTSLITVQLKYPNGRIRQFKYGTDTLQFIPANVNAGDNTAMVDFNPTLLEDGSYELLVKAKDKSNNSAGPNQYRVLFSVYNKPMISNLFNYPNPFTTSTAFVFTLTGSRLPQNIRIQILTVTGKVVKEINQAELGPIHIGRNITEYKWDGTDMYGQALGNGVYLYRVITNLDGKNLEKWNTTDNQGYQVDTDKYFKAGYGKMYLMR